MNTIYVYTTETYRDFRGWRKVGQTHQESAKMRVEQQDGTSNPEPLIIEEVFQVEDWISDHTIHAELINMGCLEARIDKKREWFECTVEDIKKAINNIKFGVSRPNSYTMRPEQQEGCDLLLDLYNNGSKKGLLNAKMRYGKCFTFYQFVKATGAKQAIILTYKPAVDASWYEDLKTHVDFDGWEYYHGRDFSNKNPFKFPKSNGKPQILFASFQDLIKNKDTNKWKNLSKYTFDAGARDEDHFGTSTERAKSVLDKVNCNFWAHLSGTPLKALMSGEFLDEEIYTWGYADEQAKRKLEKDAGWQTEVYRWLPVMKFHTFEVNEEAKKLTSCYTSEEGFTMTKMFGSEDGETFIDDAAVKLFLDQVFGIGVRKTQSPIRTHAVDHMLWVMPGNVKSVNALCKMLKKRVGDDYKILNVAGDNITKLDKVKQSIERNDKTITVTCGRFNTGVTVPEWDMVMMLDDG